MNGVSVKLPDGSTYIVKELLGDGDSNVKLTKSDKANVGYLTVGLSLAPAKLSGYEMCASRSPGCTQACLNYAGMGQIKSVQKARIAKTILFMEDRATFMGMLYAEIGKHIKRANKQEKKLAIRLNMLSDVVWEKIDREMFNTFSDVQFYDYTKHAKRMAAFELSRVHMDSAFFPLNYHLTFSRSETNLKEATAVYTYKYANVAVVFDSKALPERYAGREVINGDETDLRFLDKPRVIIGLYTKGKKGREDNSGFVVQLGLLKR
jgi:hypothetical protein